MKRYSLNFNGEFASCIIEALIRDVEPLWVIWNLGFVIRMRPCIVVEAGEEVLLRAVASAYAWSCCRSAGPENGRRDWTWSKRKWEQTGTQKDKLESTSVSHYPQTWNTGDLQKKFTLSQSYSVQQKVKRHGKRQGSANTRDDSKGGTEKQKGMWQIENK